MIQGLLLASYSWFLPANKLQNHPKLCQNQDKAKEKSHSNQGFELLKGFVVRTDTDHRDKWLTARPEKREVYVEHSEKGNAVSRQHVTQGLTAVDYGFTATEFLSLCV